MTRITARDFASAALIIFAAHWSSGCDARVASPSVDSTVEVRTFVGEEARQAAIHWIERQLEYYRNAAKQADSPSVFDETIGDLEATLAGLSAHDQTGEVGLNSFATLSIQGTAYLEYEGQSSPPTSGNHDIWWGILTQTNGENAHVGHRIEVHDSWGFPTTGAGNDYTDYLFTAGMAGIADCDMRHDMVAYGWHQASDGYTIAQTTSEHHNHCGPSDGWYSEVEWGDDGDHSDPQEENALDFACDAFTIVDPGWYDVYLDGVYIGTVWCE